MIYLLKKSAYSDEQNADPQAVFTKWYQHIEVTRFAAPYLDSAGVVCEIGACIDCRQLSAFHLAHKVIIDPYNGAAGSGATYIPDDMPYPLVLYRCLLGVDSEIIPNDLLDISFSVSVLEHIGQEASGYECQPTNTPPEGQEGPRDALCRELFRVTKPGGITFHTIDHAARNLSWRRNFLAAGFKLLKGDPEPTVNDCLDDPDAVRQRRTWWNHEEAMPAEEQSLHSVLMMAFRKPKKFLGYY
jgi:hypothetical protein